MCLTQTLFVVILVFWFVIAPEHAAFGEGICWIHRLSTGLVFKSRYLSHQWLLW